MSRRDHHDLCDSCLGGGWAYFNHFRPFGLGIIHYDQPHGTPESSTERSTWIRCHGRSGVSQQGCSRTFRSSWLCCWHTRHDFLTCSMALSMLGHHTFCRASAFIRTTPEGVMCSFATLYWSVWSTCLEADRFSLMLCYIRCGHLVKSISVVALAIVPSPLI